MEEEKTENSGIMKFPVIEEEEMMDVIKKNEEWKGSRSRWYKC